MSGTETLDRLSELLPQVSDPLDALRARERRRWADMHPWLGRADAYARTLTAAGRTWTRTRLDDGLDVAWRRGVAGIVDGVVLAGVGASLVTGAAVITGVPVRDLAREVPVPLALTWLLLAGQYLFLTSGLGGRTPGAVIARCARTGERRLSLSPRAVSRRAAQTVLEESLAGGWRVPRAGRLADEPTPPVGSSLSRPGLSGGNIEACPRTGGARMAVESHQPGGSVSDDTIAKTDEQWKQELTAEQFQVLRQHGTERAGTSPLNQEKRDGDVHVRRLRPGALRLGHEV